MVKFLCLSLQNVEFSILIFNQRRCQSRYNWPLSVLWSRDLGTKGFTLHLCYGNGHPFLHYRRYLEDLSSELGKREYLFAVAITCIQGNGSHVLHLSMLQLDGMG